MAVLSVLLKIKQSIVNLNDLKSLLPRSLIYVKSAWNCQRRFQLIALKVPKVFKITFAKRSQTSIKLSTNTKAEFCVHSNFKVKTKLKGNARTLRQLKHFARVPSDLFKIVSACINIISKPKIVKNRLFNFFCWNPV